MSFPRIVLVQNSKLQPQLIQSGRVVHLDGTYSTSEGFTTYQVSVKTAANRLVTVARFVCSCDTTTSVAAGLDAVRRWCGTGPTGGDCLAPQYLVTDNSSVGTIVHSAQRTIGPIAMHGIVTVRPFLVLLAFAVVAWSEPAACRRVFPKAAVLLCWTHFSWNLFAEASAAGKDGFANEVVDQVKKQTLLYPDKDGTNLEQFLLIVRQLYNMCRLSAFPQPGRYNLDAVQRELRGMQQDSESETAWACSKGCR